MSPLSLLVFPDEVPRFAGGGGWGWGEVKGPFQQVQPLFSAT